jgi:protein involved in temperature-dependent protein secretion
MDAVFEAIEAGEYVRAYEALQRTPEVGTPVGVAVGAFLLALGERFDDAERLTRTADVPAIALLVRGERDRLARWRDPRAAGSLAASEPLAWLGMYAGMAHALLARDAALVARIKQDMEQIAPVPGVIHVHGKPRPFRVLVDADDAIGQMLETYCGNGLLYFPFHAVRRVEFLPKRSFMDHLMPKVQITDIRGQTALAFVPLLYAGSSTHAEPMIRTGRLTNFDYVGDARGRRPSGQRDFFADGGAMIGLQGVTAIEFGPAPGQA